MKSIKKNQQLSSIEKEEAKIYNEFLTKELGISYKVRNIRDYYQVRIMYELLQIYTSEEVATYYDYLLEGYFEKTGIKNNIVKKQAKDGTLEEYFFNYGYTEALYQYWYKYYNPTVMNFVSFLAIYSGEELPYTVFENTTNTAFNKTIRFIEEESVLMVRKEMSEISKLSEQYYDELEYKVKFIWHTKEDERVCKVCDYLDNREFDYAPYQAHPNCRCYLVMVKTFHINQKVGK